jgi:hypothetical protein
MRTLTKLLSTAGIIVILLAIWRANNGDVTVMVNTVWGIIDTAADILTQIWNQVMSVDPLGTSGGVTPEDVPSDVTVP